MANTVTVSAKDVAEALRADATIQGELDDLVQKKVKSALEQFEQRGMREGFLTPDGGAADKNIKNFGDWLIAAARKDEKRLKDIYGSTKTLNESDGSEGGYTVPEAFNAQLMEVAGEVNPVDSLTGSRAPMALPMPSRSMTMPALDQTQTPAAGTSAFDAGVAAYWTAESGSLRETEPKFRTLTLNAHKLAGYTAASSELEADSAVALEKLLIRLFGRAIGRRRLHAFLRGDGVGKPLGVLNAPCSISVTRAASGNSVDIADTTALYKRMYPDSSQRAVWLYHPFLITDLASLQFGTGSQAVVWGDVVKGFPATLLGLPMYPCEFMSAPGTAFDFGLFDWSFYLIGNRGQTAIAMSEHARFLNDEKVWRFTHRVDGQPWANNTTTLSDGAGTNTVGPFAYLT